MKGGKIAAVVVSLAAAAIAAGILRGIGSDPLPTAGPAGPPAPFAVLPDATAPPPPDRPGEAPPAVPALPLVGLVLREGRPAAAEVTIRRLADLPRDEDADEEGSRFRSWGSLYEGLEPEVRERARAAGDGRFAVRNPGAGAFLLEARAGPDQTGAVALLLGADCPLPRIEIHLLDAPCVLRGRAALPDGTPWTGLVGVCLEDQERADPAPVATAADGTFRIEGLPGAVVRLFALEPGRRREAGPRVMLPCAEEVTLVVGGPAEVVSGRVVEEPGGAPVPGARVTLKSRGGGFIVEENFFWPKLLAGVSVPVDSRGRFRAALRMELEEDLSFGLSLHTEAPGFSSRKDVLSLTDIRGPAGIEIRLSRPGAVSGRVLVEGTDAPVPGARVRIPLGDAQGFPGADPRATTDAEGRFRFEGLPAGRHPVEVLAEGWVSSNHAAGAGAAPHLDVVPLGETVQDLHVVPAPWIHGRVLGADGLGVGGVTVTPQRCVKEWAFRPTFSWESEIVCLPAEVVTAPDGTFRFGAIQGTEEVRFLAWRDGRVVGAAGPYLAEAGDGTGVDILLPPERRLEVAVWMADGAPAVGALVQLEGGLFEVEEMDLGWRVPADGNGIAVFESVPETSLRVTAALPRDPWAKAEQWFKGVPGSGRIDVLLSPGTGDAVLSVTGVALLEDGTPAAGAMVDAEQEDPTGLRQVFGGPEPSCMGTDGLGRFRITGLRPGPCGISVRLSAEGGSLRGVAEAVAGQEDVRIVLRFEPKGKGEKTRSLKIRVLGPDGSPVPAGQIRWKTMAEGREWSSSGGGTFEGGERTMEFEESRFPGRIRIWAFDAADAQGRPLPFGPAFVGPLPLGEGPYELRLPPERKIQGRILGPDGSPLPGIRVSIESTPDPVRDGEEAEWYEDISDDSADADAEGRFRFGRLGDEDYRVSCSEDGLAFSAAIARPGSGEVVLRLHRTVDAEVTVLDPEGRPVGGARIRVSRSMEDTRGWPLAGGETPATGSLTLKGLDPERLLVLDVDPPGSVDDLLPHRIEGWRAADTEVRLFRGFVLEVGVEDGDGRPVPGAAVTWTGAGSDEPQRGGLTGPDGRVALGRLPQGNVTIAAELPGVDEEGAAVRVVTTADAGRVRLVLEPGPGIHIRLKPAAAAFGSVVLAVRGEAGACREVSGEDGEFHLRRLREGVVYDAVVSVDGRGGAVLRGLKPGGPPVDVVVGFEKTLRCHVLLAAGATVTDAEVLVGQAPLVEPVSRNRMAEGDFAFCGLPEGIWTVRVRVREADGAQCTFLQEAEAGGNVEVDAR